MKKVIIFEINRHHYEVIPGFCKYFFDLGYAVDVLMREHSDALGSEFSLINPSELNTNLIYYNQEDGFAALKKVLEKNKYEFIFSTSFDYAEEGKLVNVYERIKKIDNTKSGIFGCYHSLDNLKQNNDYELFYQNRIITLSPLNLNSQKTIMVNAHYFGYTEKNKMKNKVIRLVSVGSGNRRDEIEHVLDDNLHLTDKININYIGRYDRKAFIKKRIKRQLFYPLCKLLKIQPYCNALYRPIKNKKIYNCIVDLGKLKFEEMFEVISEADFILLNLDIAHQDIYLNDRTSGAKQLILGFNRPCIVHKRIAQAYGFDECNSVIYEEGRLLAALEKAVQMTDAQYLKMKMNLLQLEREIYKDSLDHLRSVIEGGGNTHK